MKSWSKLVQVKSSSPSTSAYRKPGAIHKEISVFTNACCFSVLAFLFATAQVQAASQASRPAKLAATKEGAKEDRENAAQLVRSMVLPAPSDGFRGYGKMDTLSVSKAGEAEFAAPKINALVDKQGVGAVVMESRPGAKIFYTIDGSQPSINSPIYSAPFTVAGLTVVKAVLVDSQRLVSPMRATLISGEVSEATGDLDPVGVATLAGPLQFRKTNFEKDSIQATAILVQGKVIWADSSRELWGVDVNSNFTGLTGAAEQIVVLNDNAGALGGSACPYRGLRLIAFNDTGVVRMIAIPECDIEPVITMNKRKNGVTVKFPAPKAHGQARTQEEVYEFDGRWVSLVSGSKTSMQGVEQDVPLLNIKPPPKRSMESIQEVIRGSLDDLRSIFLELAKQNTGLGGRIKLQLTIAPTGDVSAVRVVSSETGSIQLDNALMHGARNIHFGPFDGESTVVTFPLNLSQDESPSRPRK
ncbi:MAG: hypothetical protein RL173_26 [Fibrobacterota bacterium]|jgi:hypothetical protein